MQVMGGSRLDDRELLGRIAAGDDDAFAAFYQTPGGPLPRPGRGPPRVQGALSAPARRAWRTPRLASRPLSSSSPVLLAGAR
jgi:hypothetical protein